MGLSGLAIVRGGSSYFRSRNNIITLVTANTGASVPSDHSSPPSAFHPVTWEVLFPSERYCEALRLPFLNGSTVKQNMDTFSKYFCLWCFSCSSLSWLFTGFLLEGYRFTISELTWHTNLLDFALTFFSFPEMTASFLHKHSRAAHRFFSGDLACLTKLAINHIFG